MKTLYTLLLSICFSFSLSAQLADGSIAPDFTVVDINGNSHTLYDYLDEGKVVIIDLFATWCGPCWGYHETHALGDAYDMYGPNGTDELMVFGIEGDGSTNSECLYGIAGCNSSTFGDWTEGVPYAIVENTLIPGLYDLAYWPTIYIIYPDRKVYEMGQAPLATIGDRLDDIPALSAGLNPNLLSFKGYNGGSCDDLIPDAPYYLINNMGETAITSATITVTKNGEEIYQENWTGNAGSYALITEIQIPTQIITDNTVFNCELSNINGDAAQSRDYTSHVTVKNNNVIHVTAVADDNVGSDNTRYEIQNENGQVVFSQALEAGSGEQTYTHYLPTTGCHQLWVYDSGGDGLSTMMEARDGNGDVFYVNDGFLGLDVQDFNVASISGVNDLAIVTAMQLSPNPVSDMLNVSLDLEDRSTFNYTIVNLEGKQLITNTFNGLTQGQNQKQINVADLAQGLYFLTISNEEGSLTKRFIKN